MFIGSYIIYIHINTELYIHTHTYIQGCMYIWAYVYSIYTHIYKIMYIYTHTHDMYAYIHTHIWLPWWLRW